MQIRNLPSIDTRYWAALLIASVLGTTVGDYLSHGFDLGFTGGLLPLGVLLAFTLAAERWSKVSTVAFYWAAIVITRTAATNLADEATHALNIGSVGLIACLTGALAATLLAGRHKALFAPLQSKTLPPTDYWYWLAILLVSILGTVLGDYFSADLSLGPVHATLILAPVLALAFFAQSKIKVPCEVYYWLILVVVRTIGTTAGDSLTGSQGLNLGYGEASAYLAGALFCLLALSTSQARQATLRATKYGISRFWKYRRVTVAGLIIAVGLGTVYGGYNLLNQTSPQEVWYNKGVAEIRKDIAAEHPWTSYVNPDVPYLQKSILYYNNQAEAGLIDRLLYGRPNVEYAAQAYLKIGVILLYNAGQDEKLLNEAKGYLEKAVEMNPGILYARELLADVSRTDSLAIMALAPERNLEMLYKQSPQQRSKKPDKSGKKDGKGDPSQDSKNDDQKGQPDQPNDKEGDDKNDKAEQQAPASKNNTLQQNMQDVKNSKSNDGI